MNEYSIDRFANDAYRILKQFNKSPINSNLYSPALINLGISAGKFVESTNTKSIVDLFSKQTTKTETIIPIENTLDFQDIAEDENEEETVLEKPTSIVNQGDFFRKFQENEELAKTPSKPQVSTSSSSTTITSFFSRYKSNESLSNSSDDRYVTCSKCNKSILSWDMPEHEDFHYARQLQLEENQNQIQIAQASKSTKRKSDKTRTLDAFLTKKSKTEF